MKHHKHPSDKDNQKMGQPDPETLGKTDPQEHMEGPVSSAMQKVKEKAEESGGEAGDDSHGKDRIGKRHD
ncbi:MAG TPA: hypothetical protein VHD83_25390 [Puia sp.]|nr:hypothetical protein [Puia sp.]